MELLALSELAQGDTPARALEDAEALSPQSGQTFLVGDGKGRSYRVPPGATRLYLGFADGYLYGGAPRWYDNNGGALAVTVRLTRRR